MFIEAVPRIPSIERRAQLEGHKRRLQLLIVIFALAGCDDGHLRGAVSKSSDGMTYFGVVDDNGGQCGPLKVDGAVWAHPIGKVVPFKPGTHTISCGAEVTFVVPSGVIYRFDYWGP